MNHPPYPAYRDSGVPWLGQVPQGWEVKRLKLSVKNADEKIPLDEPEDLPYIGLEHIESKTGKLIGQNDEYEMNDQVNYFTNRHTLFGKLRPYLSKAYNPTFEGICSNELLTLLPRDVERTFLLYLMLSEGFIDTVNASTYGTKMPRASWDFIGNILIPIPPLPEQQAIADFLDRETRRIDALVEHKQRLLERLAEQRSALISTTVTRGLPAAVAPQYGLQPHTTYVDSGVPWLGQVPEGWSKNRMSRIFDVIGSGTTPPSDNLDWYDGNIPWITTSELREKVIHKTEKQLTKEAIEAFPTLRLYPEGSLAIAMYGATIGRLGILGVKATTNQACCVLSGERLAVTSFVFYWFQAFKEQLILLASGGGQPNISQEKIRSLIVHLPSLPEQQAIATYLDQQTAKLDALAAKVREAITRLQEYRQALITAAVTGQIDVRS
jgi:type I restriction enzyme S subunit